MDPGNDVSPPGQVRPLNADGTRFVDRPRPAGPPPPFALPTGPGGGAVAPATGVMDRGGGGGVPGAGQGAGGQQEEAGDDQPRQRVAGAGPVPRDAAMPYAYASEASQLVLTRGQYLDLKEARGESRGSRPGSRPAPVVLLLRRLIRPPCLFFHGCFFFCVSARAEAREAERSRVADEARVMEDKWRCDPRMLPGWTVHYSAKHSRCYFVNADQTETLWKPPGAAPAPPP